MLVDHMLRDHSATREALNAAEALTSRSTYCMALVAEQRQRRRRKRRSGCSLKSARPSLSAALTPRELIALVTAAHVIEPKSSPAIRDIRGLISAVGQQAQEQLNAALLVSLADVAILHCLNNGLACLLPRPVNAAIVVVCDSSSTAVTAALLWVLFARSIAPLQQVGILLRPSASLSRSTTHYHPPVWIATAADFCLRLVRVYIRSQRVDRASGEAASRLPPLAERGNVDVRRRPARCRVPAPRHLCSRRRRLCDCALRRLHTSGCGFVALQKLTGLSDHGCVQCAAQWCQPSPPLVPQSL